MRRIVDFVRRAGYKGGTGTGLALLAASAFSLAGCAVVGKIAAAVEKPTSTFRCGKFPSLDLGGASLGFTFDLDNPNGLELAGAGRVTGELVRGGVAAVKLQGTVELAGVTLPIDLEARLPGR